jgi:hypothetical protein
MTSQSPYGQHSNQELFNASTNIDGITANATARFAQIRDEANHKHCSEGNQKALLTETMNRLGTLVKDLGESNWMFDKNDSIYMSKGVEDISPPSYGVGTEELHFSLGRRL